MDTLSKTSENEVLGMGKLPSYRKHSSGQARCTINGRTFYLGRYGTKASKQRYDALIAEWLASGRSPTFGIPELDVSMADVIVGYLDHCKEHYGQDGREYIASKHLLRLVAKLYADMRAAEFGPQHFKTIRQKLVDDPTSLRTTKCKQKAKDQLSRTYINSMMKKLARMFRWAAAEGVLPPDNYQTIRLIPSLQRGRTKAAETKRVLPVDLETVRQTLEHCTPVLRDMIRVQLLVGCRPGELCSITPAMFDRTGAVWRVKLEEHKTAHHGHERILFFGPEAQRIVAPYLNRRGDANLFSPAESESQRRAKLLEQRATPTNQGNRPGYSTRSRAGRSPKRAPGTAYNTQSYGKAIKYICERVGIPPWSPNQLRHSAGTMVRREHGLEGAQVTLGHSSADVTQVYAEADTARAVEIAMKDSSRLVG
ncbi:MAG: site-specific integrase [Aureliella sp.]